MDLHFLSDLGRFGGVAGCMGDDQVGAVVGQFAQGGADVAVAESLGDDRFSIGGLCRGFQAFDALLIPAEIRALLGRDDGDDIDIGCVDGCRQQRCTQNYGASDDTSAIHVSFPLDCAVWRVKVRVVVLAKHSRLVVAEP